MIKTSAYKKGLPLSLLLLQIALVLLLTLACGWLARRLGQARVIGEIIAGIVIGPSVFGRFVPHVSAKLFPQSSLTSFDFLSNIGLVIFLFLIGMELDYEHLIRQRSTAILSSGMSILFPFITAAAIAHPLRVRFAPQSIGRFPFVLFLGISMSITAFPVLARILEERRMQFTPLGATAILCAAVDDVTAWTLLAIALTLIGRAGHSVPIHLRLLGLGAYLLFMLGVLRPLAAWAMRRRPPRELTIEFLGITVAGILLSSAATDYLGIHPLFGAFMAGLCFPRSEHWATAIRSRVDMLVSVLLLPLFFALTGMRTHLDLLVGRRIWFWALIILAAAIFGKIGGAVFAARWTGQSWRAAIALGALLNTRGLVELIVLNIAYNAGIFTPALFTMLVVMALVTTMLTTPILNVLGIGERHNSAGWELKEPASAA
jgi:Kef-type K+ transport system membrane component KefB